MTAVPDTEAEAYSWMGIPVIGVFTLGGSKRYSTHDLDESCGTMNMASFPMSYATIVDFPRSTNYSKTKVSGIHGTVKEVCGLDDRKISIRGFYMADESREGYKTVAKQANALYKFRRVTETVGVTGSIFNNKGICPIVIDNISFNPIQGNNSAVPFTIEAMSDNPYKLTL